MESLWEADDNCYVHCLSCPWEMKTPGSRLANCASFFQSWLVIRTRQMFVLCPPDRTRPPTCFCPNHHFLITNSWWPQLIIFNPKTKTPLLLQARTTLLLMNETRAVMVKQCWQCFRKPNMMTSYVLFLFVTPRYSIDCHRLAQKAEYNHTEEAGIKEFQLLFSQTNTQI